MRPFILNAYMGDNEDTVLLFVSFTHFYLMPKRQNSNVILFSDELEKKGHKVLEFKPSKFFAGNDMEKDGGYTFVIIPKENEKPEEQLMEDIYQIIEKLS